MAYSTCSSLRQPSIFFFSSFIITFLFGLLKFFIFCSLHPRIREKAFAKKYFVSKNVQNMKPVQNVQNMHRTHMLQIFRDYFFKIRDKRIFEYFHFLWGGGGGGDGGCGGGDI